jgi:zinc transport system substrate-binding protein
MFKWKGGFRRSGGRAALPLLALPGLVLAGCAGTAQGEGDDQPQVAASFYPLQYVTQRILGADSRVSSLTKPGIEPHDVSLTPRQLGSVADADLVVYLKGFQPDVDDAVANNARDAGFDVSGPARLAAHQAVEGHDRGGAVQDPHFWLDPLRLADVADAIATRLSELDPERKPALQANAAALRADLEELDAEFVETLKDCAQHNLVTSHAAFGYLADRYGFEQIGITGLDPEAEPSPRVLGKVAEFVEANDVSTIYYETLVSPDIARTVAEETGATTAVLDPIEGITKDSSGRDYLEIMRANLATLRSGQECR